MYFLCPIPVLPNFLKPFLCIFHSSDYMAIIFDDFVPIRDDRCRKVIHEKYENKVINFINQKGWADERELLYIRVYSFLKKI